MSETILYVALDENTPRDNLRHVEALAGEDGEFGFKINQDLALIGGENYIRGVQASGHPVFVDLKMNNGPRTQANVLSWLAEIGVQHTNVWAASERNIDNTFEKLEKDGNLEAVRQSGLELLGVTFYTKWDEEYAQAHHGMSLPDLVHHWAQVAVDHGCDGIILPPNYLDSVEGIATKRVTPGIRYPKLDQAEGDYQVQIATPYEAAKAGADIEVVGSAITGSRVKDHAGALQRVLEDIRTGKQDRAP